MKFALQVNSGPYSSQASKTAYHFAKAAINGGHEIYRVFFYFDGVYNAIAHSETPDDEINLIEEWSRLAQQENIDLTVCISAALRRGLSTSTVKAEANSVVAKGFRISGLGQWLEAGIKADRLLVFGA